MTLKNNRLMRFPRRQQAVSQSHRAHGIATHLILGVVLVLFGCTGDAPTDSGVEPTRTLTRDEALQESLDRMASVRQGISAAVMFPDAEVWTGVSGWSSEETAEPVRADMLFGIGSITKTFVAAMTLSLAAEGVLTLDDPLHDWLPAYDNVDGTATIRQLLNHTSGTYNYTNNQSLWTSIFAEPGRVWNTDDIMEFVGLETFSPGAEWAYSNTGYILLGLIAQAAGGTSVAPMLRSRFLSPRGLDHTFLEVEEAITGPVASGWSDLDGDGSLDDLSSMPRTALYSVAWTAGAVMSTAEDVVRWIDALYGGDVLPDAWRSQMLTVGGVSPDYGLGVIRTSVRGRVMWGHSGGIPGYVSLALHSPSDGVSLVVLVNQSGGDTLPVLDALLGIVLESL